MINYQPHPDSQISEYIYRTPIAGLLFLEHKRFNDNRGFYAELVRLPELEKASGINFVIQQLNLSHSKSNVVRGFHAENWNKLLSITAGSIFGAWADFRPNSTTFGQAVAMKVGFGQGDLSGSVFVSQGIGNAFCVTDGPASYQYAVDALYTDRQPENDLAISLFDPHLAVNWPISSSQMIISKKDQQLPNLIDKFPEKFLPK